MNSQLYNKLKLTFIYLLITALAGAFLRFMFIYDPGVFNYQYLLHSHSHTAILGWVYNAFFLAILKSFLPEKINSKKYNYIFWLTQIAVIGMTISFAVQGYAAVSISFSTLHIIMSYIFIYCFVKDSRRKYKSSELISLKFIYGGLFFLFLSSFGPWGLAIIVANGLAETDLYKQAIYFYLHFQYNGWFIFSLIGVWVVSFEKFLNENEVKSLKSAFYLLFAANIPAYFLSLLGFKVGVVIWLMALISAFVQLFGAVIMFIVLYPLQKRVFNDGSGWPAKLFKFSFFLLLVKFVLQLLSALPGAGEPAFVSREVIIAFIHLVMLGVVTPGLFGWLGFNSLIELNNKLTVRGIKIYLGGFVLSEVLLFYPSLVLWFRTPAIPYYSYLLFISTLALLAGVIMLNSCVRSPDITRSIDLSK